MRIRILGGALLLLALGAANPAGGQFRAPRVKLTPDALSSQAPGPYLLDRPNTVYVLGADITTAGTAFVVAAPNVTLDLGGHTVTYGDQAAPVVRNGGFEEGTGPTDIPGWDTSGAPGACRESARTGMWGKWMLHIPDVTSTRQIVSAPVAIPVPNREYAPPLLPREGSKMCAWR
jgi:hypothetical protein